MLSTKILRLSRSLWTGVLFLLVIATFSMSASAQRVAITYLTSDIPAVGSFNDTNLVNPWGMSLSPSGPWWISDNGTGLSTLYVVSGQQQGLVVTIPSASGSGTGTPSGTVYNGTTDFQIDRQMTPFLFCTEDGTISGWYGGSKETLIKLSLSTGV